MAPARLCYEGLQVARRGGARWGAVQWSRVPLDLHAELRTGRAIRQEYISLVKEFGLGGDVLPTRVQYSGVGSASGVVSGVGSASGVVSRYNRV